MSATPASMESPGASLPPFGATKRGNLRPSVQTDLDRLAPSSHITASQTPAATTPDALDFYRQRSSSVLSSNGARNPSPTATRRLPDRSTLRSTSNPGHSTIPSNTHQPLQHRHGVEPKASFKDLIARFDQAGSSPTSGTGTPPPRSTSASSGQYISNAYTHSAIPQPVASSRPRPTRRESDNAMTGISEHAIYNVPPQQHHHHQHRRQRSNSFATSPRLESDADSQGAVSNGPLFGEILPREVSSSQPGYGISRRRGSDTSTMHRPNAMFPPTQSDSHLSTSRGTRKHQRSMSELSIPASPSSPAFAAHGGSRTSFEEQYGMKQAPEQSYSRIPVKSSSARPSTPSSSHHVRSMSHTTPTKPHVSSHGISPGRLSGSGPRLKAKIVAPEPKQSPPLRSSRPRQQVNEISASTSWFRTDDPFQRDPYPTTSHLGAHQDFLGNPTTTNAPPKSRSPNQRNFSERAVEKPTSLQTLGSATYDNSVPRLKLDILDAQSAPGAHEEPLTGATEFEDESFDTNGFHSEGLHINHLQSNDINTGPHAVPRSVLSQVFELRRRNTEHYSMPGTWEPAQSEDDSGTIQIMLGGTPLLDKYNHDWPAVSPSANKLGEPENPNPANQSSQLSPGAWGSLGVAERPRSMAVRPDSAAYSIIDNILNQYLDQGSVTPQMLHEFTEQIQRIEPDLTEKDGYNPEEIARATLQGLIDEMKPLYPPSNPGHPSLSTVQGIGNDANKASRKLENHRRSPAADNHHQTQSDWVKRVGYQAPTTRPQIFTTGSHSNGRIERNGLSSSTQSAAPPVTGITLPEISDTGGTLGGLIESQMSRAPPIPPAPPVLLHDSYQRSISTPSAPLNAQQIGTQTHIGSLVADRDSRHSTSVYSASDRPGTSDQGKGTSSSSVKSQEDTVKEEKRLNTRRMVIKELVDTEFSYSADMKILEDIYMATGKSTDAINDDDQRVLFGNMHEIVAFTMAFQDTLKRAAAPIYSRPREKRFAQPQLMSDGRGSMSTSNSGADAPSFQEPADDHRDRQTTIGAAFWQHMTKFEKVYGDYMRNHSAANERYLKIKDQRGVQAWINECKEYAKDLTDAWDLDSLLVKPTQRMMKYHMILDSLLQKTPDNHPDRDQLQSAIAELKAATSRINESKKRSDLLDQINNPRKRTDVSLGISKVLGRRQDKLRQQIGLTEVTEDPDFLSVNEKYGGYYLKLQVVMRDFDAYKQKTDMFMAHFNALIDTWEQTMDVQDKPVHAEIESKWRRAAATIREMTQIAWVDHEAAVQRHCIDPLLTVIRLNEKTQKFMQKRRKRMPEYAKYKTMISRGDKPDKKTQEAADQYTAFTDSLKDELPKLYQLTNTLIGKCLHNFVDIQKLWHVTWRRKLLTILDEQRVPGSMEEILEVLRSDWQAPYAEVQQLGICNGAILQQAANFLSFPSEVDLRQRDSGQSSRRTTAGSQQAPSFSSPELMQGRFSEQSSQTTLVPPGQPGQRFPFPSTLEEARNAPAKYSAVTTSAAPSHVREGQEFAPANPVRSSQPGHVGRPSVDSFAPQQATRPASSSTYYTTAANSQSSHQGDSPAKTHVFSSAMPMPESPTQATRPTTPPEHQAREEVLFVAASLFEFHINQPRQEAGFRYLTYVPGEVSTRTTLSDLNGMLIPLQIFDVLGEKGELWLARNQDDPTKDVGWIWEKHFAKVVDM